jgi:hypothetical protein
MGSMSLNLPSSFSSFLALPVLAAITLVSCKSPKSTARHIAFAEPSDSAGPAPTLHPTHVQGPTWCLSYEPDTVRVTGTLQRLTFPGRPNYESVAEGDEPEAGFYLLLATPICTKGDTIAPDAFPIAAADTVQLVLDSAGYDRLRLSLGRNVTLSGTLFARHTGHHHAPLLLQVLDAQ